MRDFNVFTEDESGQGINYSKSYNHSGHYRQFGEQCALHTLPELLNSKHQVHLRQVSAIDLKNRALIGSLYTG